MTLVISLWSSPGVFRCRIPTPPYPKAKPGFLWSLPPCSLSPVEGAAQARLAQPSQPRRGRKGQVGMSDVPGSAHSACRPLLSCRNSWDPHPAQGRQCWAAGQLSHLFWLTSSAAGEREGVFSDSDLLLWQSWAGGVGCNVEIFAVYYSVMWIILKINEN